MDSVQSTTKSQIRKQKQAKRVAAVGNLKKRKRSSLSKLESDSDGSHSADEEYADSNEFKAGNADSEDESVGDIEDLMEEDEEVEPTPAPRKSKKSAKPQQSSSQNSTEDTEIVRIHTRKYHQFKDDEVEAIRTDLLAWYDKNQRKMPWRKPSPAFLEALKAEGEIPPVDESFDDSAPYTHAYAVLVSELMLQQTQVATVKNYFRKWMKEFPTVQALAAASLERVNELWAGLGYYRRAKLLHNCAQEIVNSHGGVIPNTAEKLRKLPGIGPYTAGAIASIAFSQVTPLVDGNVIRVLTRLRAIGTDAKNKQVDALLWKLSGKLVSEERPGDFNQAVMELGATLCTPTNPKCGECPLQHSCLAYQETKSTSKSKEVASEDQCDLCTVGGLTTDVTRFPIKAEKKKPRDLVTSVFIIAASSPAGLRFLVAQRPDSGLLAGFWEFTSSDHTAEEIGEITYTVRKALASKFVTSALPEANLPSAIRADVGAATHQFSHIKQQLLVEAIRLESSPPTVVTNASLPPLKWVSGEEFNGLAISKGTKKCMELFMKHLEGKTKGKDGSKPPAKKRAKKADPPATSGSPKKQPTILDMFKQ